MAVTDSNLSEARHYLDQAYTSEGNGELEEALRQCDMALQIDNELAEAYNLKGIISEQLGQGEQAKAFYRKALDLDASFDQARENLEGLEDEIWWERKKPRLARTVKAGLWGAVSYGVGSAIFGAVFGFLTFTPSLQGLMCVFEPFSHAICIGIGTLVIGKAAGANNSRLLAAVAGIAAFFLFLSSDIVQWIFLRLLPVTNLALRDRVSEVSTIIQYVLVGTAIGSLLALIQNGWRRVIRTAVILGIAFGLHGAIFLSAMSLLLLIMNLVPGPRGDSGYVNTIVVIAMSIRGLFGGCVGGAGTGFAIGRLVCAKNGEAT